MIAWPRSPGDRAILTRNCQGEKTLEFLFTFLALLRICSRLNGNYRFFADKSARSPRQRTVNKPILRGEAFPMLTISGNIRVVFVLTSAAAVIQRNTIALLMD